MRRRSSNGLRTKDRATALLAGREVSFRRVGRSYNRTVATVVVDGHDLSWCRPGSQRGGRAVGRSRTGITAHPDFGFDQG
jgi:hypothetical protein